MAQRFDNAALDAYTVANALEHFGLSTARRGPCPFCLTSPASQSFSHGGTMHGFFCHACGRGGTAAQLYAHLGGLPIGRAITEIASHLGLTASTPSDSDAARKVREAAARDQREAEEIEMIRWQARVRRRERILAAIATQPETPAGWAALGKLYGYLEHVETWLETREYQPKSWVPA